MNKRFVLLAITLIFTLNISSLFAEDGYDLWLRYETVSDPVQRAMIEGLFGNITLKGADPFSRVIKEELIIAAEGMTGTRPAFSGLMIPHTRLLIALDGHLPAPADELLSKDLEELGNEGYIIRLIPVNGREILTVTANEGQGLLYGTFHLLRLLQAGDDLTGIPLKEVPKIKNRILNHWDNLDRTVERGYAGFSLWNWHKLPDYVDRRYTDYARANASIGINGTVLTNVNANAWVLTPQYLEKVSALADVFRPYGIKVYLTARFSAPIEIGGLETADPLNPEVRRWWKTKTDDIYSLIPDFGGFLVKANSEGQPGPQDYGRSHAEGANMLAEALEPHGGIVMWRAFVYSHEVPVDRVKQAYNEFVPLDEEFKPNVFVQVKNGPLDFQPREPFHPLFGAMPETPLALELQITQEYLGQGTHLVWLAPLFKECLQSDTWAKGESSTVAKVIDGSLYDMNRSAIAGVSNIGTDRNWTGHIFGQANWYAFGRLAWDHNLSSDEIASEWIRLTFSGEEDTEDNILRIMNISREAVVNYMTPLGLHHIMAEGHHYGPGPWVDDLRPDWTSVYYHQADSEGIGFDRTRSGSNALAQYEPEVQKIFSDPETCPDEYLLWFHHLPWDYKMKSGNTLWDELCFHYDAGVHSVKRMQDMWESLNTEIDEERFNQVEAFLKIQAKEAKWWKNACLLYFQQFSNMDFPGEIEKPEGNLEEYMSREFPYAPGI